MLTGDAGIINTFSQGEDARIINKVSYYGRDVRIINIFSQL
jgi:hypothetical protein